MSIGNRIKRLREDAGMSAEDLGKKLGVAKTTIYRYESGSIEKIPADTLNKIAFHLGTTPEYILGHSGEQGVKTAHEITEYDKMVDKTAEIMKAIQKNPRLAILFDKTGKMETWQLNVVLSTADAVLKEKDAT